MKIVFALCLCLAAFAAGAADQPYDEAADAKLAIRQALAQAATTHVPVLVVFGANWCADCKILDMAMKTGTSAPLVSKDFRVVKVDVGRFDRNVDVAESYGVPLKQGIPAIVVLSPTNKVLYATRTGELADAREMGERGIHDFLLRLAGTLPKS
jgi:protein disulfide-isomerase